MGKNRQRRRRRRRPERSRVASPEYSRVGETSTAYRLTTIDDLTDDLLELVLLRIRSPFCLVRGGHMQAVAAGDRRHLLPPPLPLPPRAARAGPLHVCDKIVFVPSPVPPGEVPAVDDVRSRVSLDFLRSQPRQLADSRDGLLAVVEFSNIVVCDPWTRQEREIHRWFPWRNGMISRSMHILGVFFLDADDDEPAHLENFRVLCVHVVEDYGFGGVSKTAGTSVYSAQADGGCWRLLSSTAIVGDNLMSKLLGSHWSFVFVGRGGGSLCWSVEGNNVLHVDESTGEFKAFSLPPTPDVNGYGRWNLRVVGTRRLVRVVGDALEVLTWMHGCAECVVESRYKLSQLANVQASPEWPWFFLDTAAAETAGHVVLLPHDEYMWMFVVDVETMELERVQKRNWHADRVFPYELPWPPTIKACV